MHHIIAVTRVRYAKWSGGALPNVRRHNPSLVNVGLCRDIVESAFHLNARVCRLWD